MATIDASKAGYIIGQASGNFTTARQNVSSVVASPSGNHSNPLSYAATSGRGSLTHAMRRVFLYFDTSELTGTISDTSLNIVGVINGTADLTVAKSTAFGGDGGTTLAASDFFSTIDFSTPYSSQIEEWSTNASNDIDLNSTANTDIQNNDFFICALLENDKDFANTASTSAVSRIAGIAFGTTITLTFTEAGASGPANLVKFSGIAKGDITSINGITMANIVTLNGIS